VDSLHYFVPSNGPKDPATSGDWAREKREAARNFVLTVRSPKLRSQGFVAEAAAAEAAVADDVVAEVMAEVAALQIQSKSKIYGPLCQSWFLVGVHQHNSSRSYPMLFVFVYFSTALDQGTCSVQRRLAFCGQKTKV
jgi:hypothetical protein